MNLVQNTHQKTEKEKFQDVWKNFNHHPEKKEREKDKAKIDIKKLNLSDNEIILLKIAIDEYSDLFPEILNMSKNDFLASLQKYILINISPKNIILPTGTLSKILKIIESNYYQPEYDYILSLIKTINSCHNYLSINNANFLTHCSKTRKALHKCGEKLLLLGKGKFLFCKKCNLLYSYKSVLLQCDYCLKEYYTEIKDMSSKDNNNLRPATWAKYHCNALINDVMKCLNCASTLYLNNKKKLCCLKCKTEMDPLELKWKCMICSKQFTSEAKEYDPFYFKIMKVTVKQTLFKGLEAKPTFVPCCNIPIEQINSYKFYHKKECNGLLYQGDLDNKKIVVCSKCHMLNYYFNHYWMCPICKKKFRLNDYINNNDNKNIDKNSSIQCETANDSNNNSLNQNQTIWVRHKSISEFNKKKKKLEDNSDVPQELKSCSIPVFPSNNDKSEKIQVRLKRIYTKEENSIYRTNESKEEINFDENLKKRESESDLIKYNLRRNNSKNQYNYSNNNFYSNANNKNEKNVKILNYDNSETIPSMNNSNCISEIKVNSSYKRRKLYGAAEKSEADVSDSFGIEIDNSNNMYNTNENAKKYQKKSSFKKISNLCLSKSTERNKKLLGNNLGRDNKNMGDKVFISNFNNNECENESSEIIDKRKYNPDMLKNNNVNISQPIENKNNPMVSNNIHINVNLNLNISNNGNSSNINTNEYYMPSPQKQRPRMNSAKDIYVSKIASKLNNHQQKQRLVSENIYKKNSRDIITNNFNINDYTIIKQIGEGTFGKIFEVENDNHYHFALKKLLANSIKEMEMLKSEYELLLGLEGLNINLIHIYGIESKKLDKTTFVVYVLMELAQRDWEKEIANREKKNWYYSEEELIIILKNLVNTFAELQRHSISHRDIKPQNILLCDDNILKIADFGEAKEARNRNNVDTMRQTIRGTELYMSPILFDSLKTKKRNSKYILHNSYKSDVFSLGFCMLLAATLKVDSLYAVREVIDMISLRNEVNKFLQKRYSEKLINTIIYMLELEEKNRVDFIELENIVQQL